MRVLILSCNTGEGHNSCARAIQEYCNSCGDECVIEDGLAFVSPAVSRVVSSAHSYIYKHLPWLFRLGYAYTEKHPTVFREKSAAHRLLTRGKERMYRSLSNGQYDAVISTHIFTALMLTDLLSTHPMNLLTGFVNTDYICHPGLKDSNLKYYFLPNRDLFSDFACKGISEEKMIPSGIPIRQMFYTSCDPSEAKSQVGVDPAYRHLLVMCGSMGCGPIPGLVRKLSCKMPKDWHLSVICGTNQSLEKKLSKEYRDRKNIHVHGFVKDMGVMMDSADLYLTKPGGISVTEAAAKQLPMVLIDAVAGCEEYNRMYLIRKGAAKTAATVNELTDICLDLMQNEEKRRSMRDCLAGLCLPNAAQTVYQAMKTHVE